MKEIKTTTSIIELRPDKKYIFVIDGKSGLSQEDAESLASILKKKGIEATSLLITGNKGIQVIEK